MNFFNIDCHISVILDLKCIFEEIGHQVTSKSISGHNWVLGKSADSIDIINQSSWHHLNNEMCDLFYKRYKDELSGYDAFICTYPPSFSMLYEKFDKPVLLHVPIRYEVPFHNDGNKWNSFNNFLRYNIDKNKIIPVSNSLYDKKYFEFFVQRECDYIPSLCEYTNTKWSPTSDNFLLYSQLDLDLSKKNITDKKNLGRYKWEDISKFKGIIMFPYNCSLMSIFEYYSSNIPLFCPSKKFMLELYSGNSNIVLHQLTWNQVFNLSPGSIIDCDRNRDPNNYKDLNIISEWIQYSDFYNVDWMPFITYFDSFDDLYFKMENTDLVEVSKNMENFNVSRKNHIISRWKEKINSIK